MQFRGMILAALVAMTAAADVPVTGVTGAGIRDLAGTATLVTIVFKEADAQEPNAKVLEVGDSYLTVQSANGDRNSYQMTSLREVRVQGGKVEAREFSVDEGRALSKPEKEVVTRALMQARTIYDSGSVDQRLKMNAAVLLAVSGNQDAHQYLTQLAAANDLPTALEAVARLYLAGDSKPQNLDTILTEGLKSGKLPVYTYSMMLAGLTQYRAGHDPIMKSETDRFPEKSAPAVRALARLNERDAVPTALEMITDDNDTKGEAAIFALTQFGGKEVVDALTARLSSAKGIKRDRIIRALAALGDANGKKLLRDECMASPTLARQAAINLARTGDLQAMQFLRDALSARSDPTPFNLIFRAQSAAALLEGGDPSAIIHLQELLRKGDMGIQLHVYELIACLGKRALIPITQSGIEEPNPLVSLSACEAVMAIADSGFRERLMAYKGDSLTRAAQMQAKASGLSGTRFY